MHAQLEQATQAGGGVGGTSTPVQIVREGTAAIVQEDLAAGEPPHTPNKQPLKPDSAVSNGGFGSWLVNLATYDLSNLTSFREQHVAKDALTDSQLESQELSRDYGFIDTYARLFKMAWSECRSDIVARGVVVAATASLPYYLAVVSSKIGPLLSAPPADAEAAFTALNTQVLQFFVGTALFVGSSIAASHLTSTFRLKMEKRLTREVSETLNLKQEDIESEKTKKLINSVNWNKHEIIEFIQSSFSAAKDVASCVVGLAVLAWYTPWAALAMTGVGLSFTMSKLRSARDNVQTDDRTNETRQGLYTRLWYQVSPDAVRQIKLLGKQKEFANLTMEALSEVTSEDLALARRDTARNTYVGSKSFVTELVIFSTLVYQTMAHHFGIANGITYGQFLALTASLALVRTSLESLRDSVGDQFRTLVPAKRFLLITDRARDIIHEQEREASNLPFNPQHPPRIELINISYRHPNSQSKTQAHNSQSEELALIDTMGAAESPTLTLKNVSLVIDPGSLVAICGDTGSGKSTLFDLIGKVRTPEGGAILVDGHDLNTIPQKPWADFISIHVQNFQLFQSLTVGQNAKMGANDSSSISFDGAAKDIGAEFIDRKGLKEDTIWGPDFKNGAYGSGGQQQQLALLRTAMKPPKVLIVDEPTSALGPKETEKFIAYIRKAHATGATVIFSAHNYNLFKTLNPDTIVVLKDGRIETQGNHDALMTSDNTYSINFRKFQGHSSAE